MPTHITEDSLLSELRAILVWTVEKHKVAVNTPDHCTESVLLRVGGVFWNEMDHRPSGHLSVAFRACGEFSSPKWKVCSSLTVRDRGFLGFQVLFSSQLIKQFHLLECQVSPAMMPILGDGFSGHVPFFLATRWVLYISYSKI